MSRIGIRTESAVAKETPIMRAPLLTIDSLRGEIMRNEVRAGNSPPAVQPTNGPIISVGREDALGMIGFCENNHDGQLCVKKGDEPAARIDYELMSIAV